MYHVVELVPQVTPLGPEECSISLTALQPDLRESLVTLAAAPASAAL